MNAGNLDNLWKGFMKKSILATIIFSCLHTPISDAKEPKDHPFGKDIVLQCTNECDVHNVVKNYMKHRKYFYSGDQNISVEKYGQEVFSTTVSEYFSILAKESRKLRNKIKSSANLNSKNSIKGVDLGSVTPLDAPLTCENDPDFTCEEWSDSEAIAEINSILEVARLHFTVTQEYLDGCNDAANFGASVILGLISVPATSILIAKYGLTFASQLLLNAGTTTVAWNVATTIGDSVCNFAQVGDRITIEDGTAIIEPDEVRYEDEFGDTYWDDWDDPIEGFDSDTGLTCVRVLTGIAGSGYYTADWTCFFS